MSRRRGYIPRRDAEPSVHIAWMKTSLFRICAILAVAAVALGQEPPEQNPERRRIRVIQPGNAPATPRKPIGEGPIRLQFPNSDVHDVLIFYEKLIGKSVIYDNQVVGPVRLVTPEAVDRDKAVALIEKVIFANGFQIVDAGADAVRIVGLGQNAREVATIPVYSKEEDLPRHERLVTFLFKLRDRKPAELVTFLGRHIELSPNRYVRGTEDEKSGTVLVTERSSVIRELRKVVEAFDVPDAKKK